MQSTLYDAREVVEYKTVSDTRLLNLISEIIDDVNVIANLPYTVTRMLLAHFNWDKEIFLDRYFACADDPLSLNKLFKDAHIANSESISEDTFTSGPMNNESDEMTCAICFDSFTSESSASLDCGHSYCKSCWVLYLTEKILDQGESHYISCPDTNCHVFVDDRKVLSLIEDRKTRSKYIKLIINQFVVKNRRLKWCPSVDCASAIELKEIASSSHYCLTVECAYCHKRFCFHCLEDPHDPVSCSGFLRWKTKCLDKDHVESMNYINANTKECPKCKVSIEKNGGCNHMSCSNCKHSYCWLCGYDLTPSGPHTHNCNSYIEKASTDVSEIRARLKRFVHYCDRFLNHQKSIELESKLQEKIEDLKEGYVAMKVYSLFDLRFMDEALETLKRCRRTLMHTYAFGFFLDTNNQQIIFEENQLDLETATEKLSDYLENSLEITEDPTEVKIRTVDDAKYCESRRQVLVSHVREGYENGWWEYRKDL